MRRWKDLVAWANIQCHVENKVLTNCAQTLIYIHECICFTAFLQSTGPNGDGGRSGVPLFVCFLFIALVTGSWSQSNTQITISLEVSINSLKRLWSSLFRISLFTKWNWSNTRLTLLMSAKPFVEEIQVCRNLRLQRVCVSYNGFRTLWRVNDTSQNM